ncbi:DUF2510 domain-containing protein [Streptomyces sp. NPDC057430]|uniref:DUF2510 domain-containing protein n=1 Tax=Streptomyces sp. NPDC057430 TaxID=3346131 RepID=UPI0036850331
MSMITQPGWYPDSSTPGQLRWWDGTAWTEHTSPAVDPAAVPPQSAQSRAAVPPPPPGAPAPGDGGIGGLRRRPALLAVVAAAVVAACVTGALLLGGGDGGGGTPLTLPPPAPSQGSGGEGGGKTEPDDGKAEPTELADQLSGISLPVPSGWEEAHTSFDGSLWINTKGPFTCPGDPIFCRHGRVSSRPLPAEGASTPEAMARRDIAEAASALYGTNELGLEPYGRITSHEEVKAEPVRVADRDGYLVRWRVVTGDGPGGWVQSLALPATTGPDSMVVIRYAFDAGPDGPPLSLMEEITRGIRTLDG